MFTYSSLPQQAIVFVGTEIKPSVAKPPRLYAKNASETTEAAFSLIVRILAM